VLTELAKNPVAAALSAKLQPTGCFQKPRRRGIDPLLPFALFNAAVQPDQIG
jgi:hypothetical protein